MIWTSLNKRFDIQGLGFLPDLISDLDPRKVAEQLEDNYAHGGGWRPNKGFKFNPITHALNYPGDPALLPLATAKCRDETLYFYDCAFLCVVQTDGSWEVSRVD